MRKNRRFILLLFSYLALTTLKAQTLYWVGGNGNFNDPNHWSLTSGGSVSNQTPNSGTDVVFDDNSGKGYFFINFAGENHAKSFNTSLLFSKAVKFTGNSGSSLNVAGSFYLSNRVRFEASTEISFESVTSQVNTIDFGKHKLNSDLTFNSGNYIFITLQVNDNKTIRFGSGKYTFNFSNVSAGNIINESNAAQFIFNKSYFLTQNKFKIAPQANIQSEETYVMANTSLPGSYSVPLALSASKGYTSVNTVNVVCPVTISLTPACNGPCTGVMTVSLSPTCTNAPYSVQAQNNVCPSFTAALSSTNIPSVFTVTNACQCAGLNYNIVVKDASNVVQSFLNGNFTPVNAILFDNNTSPLCSYSCDGTIQGSIFGTPPFTVVVVATGTTIPSFTTSSAYSIANMCGGTYTFNITDAGGCFTSLTNQLIAPLPLLANPVTSSISCNGSNTGSLSISPSGGTANYTVNFSNSTMSVTNGSSVFATGLGIGPISATITDAQSCTTTANANIIQPSAALNAVYSQTNLTCNNVCIGAASSTVTGGTAPYTYSWTPGPGSGSVVTGLCAGTKTLNVSDFNGCTSAANVFTITEPAAITLTPTFTNVVCSGSCTGVASVAASGGVGSFIYTWVGPLSTNTISTGAANSINTLCAGSYTAYVKDSPNNCLNSVVITITQPSSVTLTTASQNVSCFGANNGSATVTATGGNGAPYTYNWTPGAFSTSVITGLGPNTYNVNVFDAQLCPTATNITITEPAGLFPTVTFTNLTCNSANAPCDGKINAAPVGGTLPYSYTLTTPGSTLNTAPPYTNLCAANYTLMVRDVSGCPQQSLVTLGQPGPLLPTISTTSVNCFGGNTGGLTGSPSSGGTPTYALSWITPTGSATGNILSNQPAGNYTLTVTDLVGCTAKATATVVQPSAITITVGTSNISCYSICNGVLTSTVNGGTGPYSYAWTNSLNINVGSAATATALCPGPYTLTITDNNLCTRTATGAVLSPGPIVLTSTANPVNCFGDSNGSATVSAGGGTPSFTFQFNSAPTVSNTTGLLTGQPSGSYIATVTDFAGCVQTKTFAITSPTALAAVISGTGSCNVCNGTATITPSFGTLPYTYLWTSSVSGTFATTSTVGGLCPANYTATVTDSKGCSMSRTITITQIISISINPGAASILCNGALTGSATTTPSGGTPGYSYLWTPSSQTNSVITGVGAGTYTVQVTDNSSPAACSQTAAITLSQPSAMTVAVTPTNVTCFGFNNGGITSTVTGGTPGYTYSWSPGSQTTPSITGLIAGTYTLLVKDLNLCPKTQTVLITQSPSITITYTAVNPSGCAVPNGSICTTATGGSGAGYTYTWSPISGNSNCLSGLNGGTYQHTVTDGAGCSNTVAVTLFNATGPTLTAVSTSVTCFGASTGAATVTAVGVAPFTFTWSPSVANTPVTNGSKSTVLSSGIYVVACSDVAGCVTSTTIPIVQPSSVTINSSVTNAKCNAVCNGSITVNPSGGTPGSPVAYTYSWLPLAPPITGQGTKTVTGLCANPYTLNLTDGNSCLTQYTFSVSQPTAITVSAVTSSLSCFNVCTGSIVANATGGTGSINYSWTPVGATSATVINLCATTGTNPPSYTLIATDQNGCSVTKTYTIAQPPALTNTVNVLNATCSNSCNAVASQTAGGGVSGYNYSWSSSTLTTASLGSLCAGIYTAVVTDANGCTNAKQYTVTPPAPLNVTLTPFNPLCNGACNGSITTLVSGAQGVISYSWSPTGSGQNPTGLCATPNPIYTLVATDANSCKITAVTTLTNRPALLASVSATNPLCHNNSNGLAAVSVSNAIGTTNYTWVPTGPPSQTTQTASGLASGPYTVMVKDANNCQASQTFTLINPPTLIINTSLNPASCSLSNGAITANPSGGTPGSPVPYTYTWTGVVSSSSAITNVPAGTYTVSVSDGLGCSTSTIILLNNSSGPNVIPIISSSIICNTQCTGAASVNVSGIQGGLATYTASWLAPAPSTVNPLTNLCAGVYTAKILDANGCIGFTNVTIAEPPPIVVSPMIALPLCPGICNGSITLNTSGGNAPYTYSWQPVSSSSSIITNLCQGDYTVTIGYNGICSTTTVVNLPDQSSITIVPSVTNNICFGTCNGITSLSISGGTSPYTAGWNNGQTGATLNSLCNGSYSVIVTDNNGCSNTATAAITSGAQITTSMSVVSPSCGVCDGTASITASGSSPFSFNWSTSATTPTVSNLCAGIYQVIVTDAFSCSQTQTIIINNSNGITAENFTVQQIPCSGSCVGAATVNAVGGTSPIAYNWLNPVLSNSIITNLCPGTYFVQMSDALGCIRISSVTINPMVTLTVSPFVYLPACGANNGSISIAISGGTPSYNIVWNPPAGQTTSLTNLFSGVYSYTVTESGTNSCSVSNAINISNSAGPEIQASQSNINCFGLCTGSIAATSTGTNTPITYSWSTGAVVPNVVNLCKGVVTLTVSDFSGCKVLRSFTITDNPLLQLGSSNVHNPVCYGDCNGSIQLVPNGGVLPYTYSWTVPNVNLNPLSSLCDGTYSVSVIDAKGCVVNSSPFTIKSASSISLTANTSSSSCTSALDGTITVSPSGGIAEYVYSWQGPSGFTATTQNLVNVSSGSYTVKVVDNLGCKKDSVLKIVPSLTVVTSAGTDEIICPGTGSVILNANNSPGIASYKWFSVNDKNRGNILATGPSYLVKDLSESSGFVLVATSTVASCTSEDTVVVNLYNLPAVDAGRDFMVPVYSTVTLGGHPSTWTAVTLTWSPAMYLNDPSISNPIASNTVNVTYTLTVTDVNGCLASDSVHVELYPELKISSGFTPNGDGKNDLWIIDYIDQFPATTVDIFNRWGDIIFTSSGYQTPFDGKYKGAELPVGTYYYIIKLNHPGYPKPITGPLTIFR